MSLIPLGVMVSPVSRLALIAASCLASCTVGICDLSAWKRTSGRVPHCNTNSSGAEGEWVTPMRAGSSHRPFGSPRVTKILPADSASPSDSRGSSALASREEDLDLPELSATKRHAGGQCAKRGTRSKRETNAWWDPQHTAEQQENIAVFWPYRDRSVWLLKVETCIKIYGCGITSMTAKTLGTKCDCYSKFDLKHVHRRVLSKCEVRFAGTTFWVSIASINRTFIACSCSSPPRSVLLIALFKACSDQLRPCLRSLKWTTLTDTPSPAF
eukprot:534747-Pleurochrysis_carterae.AAC.1